MHDSMTRLYDLGSRFGKFRSQSELATKLGESAQTVNNWESRGISYKGANKVEKKWGWPARYLKEGGEPPKEPSKTSFAEAIRNQEATDPYPLIEQALDIMVIVGEPRDEIITLIKKHALQAEKVKQRILSNLNGKSNHRKEPQ